MTATATGRDAGERGGAAGLSALFAPRGIAVVGASRHADKMGAALAAALHGFAGAGGHLALVNRRDETMHGSVRDAAARGPVDLAMLCVPAPACPDALAEAAAAGARAAVVCGGGFAESGDDGALLQRALADVVARTGIRLLGPNTSGFLAPPAGVAASFVPAVATVPPGRIAVVAASGGVNHALAFLFAEAGHGVSLAVGIGNGIDVTTADVLEHLADDPHTGAVALHVESVADGPSLVAAVRRLTTTRPVVALVVGRHDVGAFAASHTGALATTWRITRAALAQAGAVLADDERELVDAVGALAVTRARPAADPGVGVVTAQAGPGLLVLDDLRSRDARIPELGASTQRVLAEHLPPLTYQRNPVDTGRPGPGFGDVLAAVAADDGVDVVAGYALYERDATDLVDAARQGRSDGVPLVLGVGGSGPDVAGVRAALLGAGIAVAGEPRGVAAAAGALLVDAHARHRAAIPPGRPAHPPPVVAGDCYDEAAAKDLLDRLGIATAPRRACADRRQAHRALRELGGPVAVKLLDPAVLHKTEVGGVRLGVGTATELDAALDALAAAGARRFLVEAMAPQGVDLVAGARRDPVFGPVVLLGLGGTTAEAFADVAVRLAPVPRVDAAAMGAELDGRALLEGFRGGPIVDAAELGRTLAVLGELLAGHPHLDGIEINPLRVTADGLVALDAVVTTREVADAEPNQ